MNNLKKAVAALAGFLAPAAVAFTLSSPDFKDQSEIPAKFTCHGVNAQPTLVWDKAPQGTASFVLTLVDPDAPRGPFIHWILYNISAEVTRLDPNTREGMGGLNTMENTNYIGPCPPSGTHHYIFTLYALDANLNFGTTPNLDQLTAAMKPHVIESAQLVGLYSASTTPHAHR